MKRKSVGQIIDVIHPHIVRGPELLGNRSDRIPYSHFLLSPASGSLALVEPQNLRWYRTIAFGGKPQVRAIFELYGQEYDLVVTDPVWEQRLSWLPEGYKWPANIVPEIKLDDRPLLTVSLGEPFERDNCCYKLVAAVIILPRHWRKRL